MTHAPDDDPVTRALRRVDRTAFLPEHARRAAGADRPIDIGHGQTNSQPTTVERMLRLLDVREGQHVLDVGTGSGWTAALLARLVGPAGSVVGVERVPELAGTARSALQGTTSVEILDASPGTLGVPDRGPYDRILVSAEPQTLPQQLVDQLDEDGVMVIPVAGTMHRVARTGDGVRTTTHGAYRFVPLISDS
ncbi:MAG: methyltransferase domain-containing protein [Nesterenkonia sp.]|nr:methyltransferase domain-containing protein [Nesterenkonia sp.]